jgi:hypothetical protein
MTWVFTRDWPIIFGGKPYWSVPAFIPITFEVTVLFCRDRHDGDLLHDLRHVRRA